MGTRCLLGSILFYFLPQNRECQKAQWSTHKTWCKRQKEINDLTRGFIDQVEGLSLVRYGAPEEERTYPKPHYSPRCDNCNTRQKEGTVLKRCNGCGNARYCGDICQKEDWPHHRQNCRLNRESKATLDADSNTQKMKADLEKFVTTFRLEMYDAAVFALKVHYNRMAGFRSAFEICLLYNPGAEKAHCRFKLSSWKCVPFAQVEQCIVDAVLYPTIDDLFQEEGSVGPNAPVHTFIIVRVVDSQYKQRIVETIHAVCDPDLGPYSGNWENDFIHSIEWVQQGMPKLGRSA
ncbi:hypothetical protein B0H16DRAFT_1490848 [Mycena metata]|uniref:MYND-type domain-containing protein n=1 Tax=Mycena metata TaxID=1033252 RepID=A0AAD7P3D8_9AGAR|nr:hypothetical protein B0H16DRAFT_1490848 [Mycena metata]